MDELNRTGNSPEEIERVSNMPRTAVRMALNHENIEPHEYKNVLKIVRLKTTGKSFRTVIKLMNQSEIIIR